jgi:hypothetical protein
MPSSQFTTEDNEIKSTTSWYTEELHTIDPRGLSQRRMSRELILDQSWLFSATVDYNVHGAFPLLYCLPLLIPLAPLSNPLSLTWNPPSCDRIRPPRSQVTCKLTSPFSTLSPPFPLQIPRTQVTQRLTKTTLRRIRRLLSGTVILVVWFQKANDQLESWWCSY